MITKKTICINGFFLAKLKTGIGQYNLNILSELLKNNKYNYLIYIPKLNTLDFKKLPQIIQDNSLVINLFYPREDLLKQFIWEYFYFPYFVGNHNFHLAWSPYQSVSIISKIPHIMTIHDIIPNKMKEYIPNWKYNLYFRFLNIAIKKVTHIITISNFCKKEISSVINIQKDKIDVTYLAPTKHKISKRANIKYKGINNNDKFILYLGGLDIRKNVVNLIKAFNSISKEYPTLKLYIPGNYFEHPLIPDLPNLINNLRLEKKVKLLGYIDDNEVNFLLQKAEMLVYPSLYEGFGLPILEGWINNIPVITSDIGAMKEISQDGALLVDPNNIKSISRGIDKVLSDNNLKKKLIKNGQKRLLYFDWNKTTKETEEIFQKRISSK